MQTLTLRTNSETYGRIIKGIGRFGNDYRHCYNRKHYFIVSAKIADKNHVEFFVERSLISLRE